MKRTAAGLLAAAMLLACAACSSSTAKKPDKITAELLSSPKEVLFEKGKALLARKKYDAGRKYLNFVF